MRKVQLPDQKSGIGQGGMRGGRAGSCPALSHSARQPPRPSGGVHCGPMSYHRPVCREARDAETEAEAAALPDRDPSTRHHQYVTPWCGAAPGEGL